MVLLTNSAFSNLYKIPFLLDELPRLLQQGRGNSWMQFESLDLHIRVGNKLINGLSKLCIQLANLRMPEDKQHQGTFTRALTFIKTFHGFPIYVENLHNREFYEALRRRGFVIARIENGIGIDLVLLRH